jgi:hypothetical protein
MVGMPGAHEPQRRSWHRAAANAIFCWHPPLPAESELQRTTTVYTSTPWHTVPICMVWTCMSAALCSASVTVLSK